MTGLWAEDVMGSNKNDRVDKTCFGLMVVRSSAIN
jgi:hypothetical protein